MQFDLLINPSDAELDPVHRELVAFNRAVLGKEMYVRLAAIARDNDRLMGGAYGELLWDWLHVDAVWVADDLRGKGIGTRLLQRIEAAALQHGITRAHVETTSFQAYGFYAGQGYSVFGQLADKPEGHTMYFMKKDRLR